MLTVESFVSQYDKYTEEELFLAYQSINDYSPQAQEALWIAIEKRGGLDVIEQKQLENQSRRLEEQRIATEVAKLYAGHPDLDFLKTIITSKLFSPEETGNIIEEKYHELSLAKEDEKIKPKTIFGSIVGGSIGSVIGGILWGLQMIQMHRMFYIFAVGLAILSYGLIRFFTKQTKANIVVVVATALSVIGALLIGQLLFEVYG